MPKSSRIAMYAQEKRDTKRSAVVAKGDFVQDEEEVELPEHHRHKMNYPETIKRRESAHLESV